MIKVPKLGLVKIRGYRNLDELTDRITVTYNASDKVKNAIEEFSDYIKKETLATKLEFSENANEEFFIDNERVLIAVSKN